MVEMNGDLTPETIREMFRDTSEFMMKRYELGEGEHPSIVYLLYCDGMIKSTEINEMVLPLLRKLLTEMDCANNLDLKLDVRRLRQEELIHQVFSGQLVIYLELHCVLYGMDLADIPQRQPEESSAEMAVKGSRDAFVEELITNIALVRKRLRSRARF